MTRREFLKKAWVAPFFLRKKAKDTASPPLPHKRKGDTLTERDWNALVDKANAR